MLKRLELVGFKSFADKTVFQFGDGVTAIVGPNGSGKSNVVDAVRWILGEQSAKSLRGGEMTDVIFNGSSGRRSLGLAEVTLTFDNSTHRLTHEADEVQITRRVYRSGEGEYLINQQVCRLRDIKEMFLGSGAGQDAYCIIEQGKVDVLLQASNKERRTIFEEAAGISRFKAKKVKTLRKLERVDQNLTRLKDIVDEVEKQLRSVKLQASKAQRYKEYADRLKELRLDLGLREYGTLKEKLETEGRVLEELRTELNQRAGRAGACEAESERLEIFLADLEDNLHEEEAKLGKVLQQIKSDEATLSHEGNHSEDLTRELERICRRQGELVQHVRELEQAASRADTELADADAKTSDQRQVVEAQHEELKATQARLQALQAQTAADKDQHLERMRHAAHLQNDAVACKAQHDNLTRERDRLRHKSVQAAEHLASIDVELQELTEAETALQERLTRTRQECADLRQERDRLQQLADQTGENISTLRQQRSGLSSRIEVLEGLIRSHEGLGTGVREVLALLEQGDGPWRTVLGMIADFLTVKREYAPLIDLALGDWAQRFLVRDVDQLVEALRTRPEPFSGRVSFLPLERSQSAAEPAATPPTLPGNRLVEVALLSRLHRRPRLEVSPSHPGMVAPAEQVVSCDHPDMADLPAQLLGNTFIVQDLHTAQAVAAHLPGYRLITLQGELLEPDGTVTVGTYHAETGILSRKSELLDLKEQLSRIDRRLEEIEHDLVAMRERREDVVRSLSEKQEESDVLTEQAADLRARLENHRDRRQGLHEEVSLSREEMQRLDEEIADLAAALHDLQAQVAQAEEQVQALHERMHQADEELRRRDHERQEQQGKLTQSQVALAKLEERLESLRSQHQQIRRSLHQRNQESAQSDQLLASARSRLTDSQLAMLHASARLAHFFLDKEHAQLQVASLISQRDAKRQDRTRLAQHAQAVRGEWRVQQEHVHNRELEAKDQNHQLQTLLQRIRDDYQIDLAELYLKKVARGEGRVASEGNPEPGDAQVADKIDEFPSPLPTPPSPLFDTDAANEEIAELRRKLSRLGSVNLESLQELEELDTRARELQAQWDDLTSAKKSLDEVIGKINNDSRRMFADTFATIRTHFQELFRKLFSGGMADIILEDETDILESGIEIIARPPGKELRSISLMSGGEKTMTAVALLLAIFRSRPSPFCILDEVDAALDEANIARFTEVLREFLDQSQFILITHSKKTMACADVLYGITMQESGISKQVAIRFEDWVEQDPVAANGAQVHP